MAETPRFYVGSRPGAPGGTVPGGALAISARSKTRPASPRVSLAPARDFVTGPATARYDAPSSTCSSTPGIPTSARGDLGFRFSRMQKNETRGLCYTSRNPGTSRKSCGLSVQSAAPWRSAQAAIARSSLAPSRAGELRVQRRGEVRLGGRKGHGRIAGQQGFLCRELRADSRPAQPFEQHQTRQRDAVTVFDDRGELGQRASRAGQGVDESGRIEMNDHADRRPPRRRAA